MRRRQPKGALAVWWGREYRNAAEDLLFWHDKHSWDAQMLHHFFCHRPYGYDGKQEPSLVEELEKRGFDIKTLRFSIQRKPAPQNEGERP
jgi:hypothetical protein